ncbi:putative ATP-dependent RNA helicase [Aspergillus luchuensis]|uniref:ATP-dependent RNA helicase n=1 Tax=Aspergillus kawachii TaxID=1069201 RepID=A0A146F661_ASPKA|nr:ATP-dependent RNA helicase dbp7 [Aspergillus luchuensis]BCR98053.1 ATP-dependent RNA helicase dbp7 [Aspergillus luchuensis]BCS10504.1 ATP-dependent RNA helicase dbp7 [Aspergillus luchuensis]GAA83235.1 ATP dependent RNA helicase [Aspergillus luchuensis IFO 4308]GAT21309.1 ATP dependent RNA helicase [Aspergillus luchuensis]
MADDGLLLNFTIPDTTVLKPEKTKVKGGTWRDRLSAKKIAAHRTNNPRKEKSSTDGEQQISNPRNPNRIQVSGPRPVKRQRIGDDDENGGSQQQPRQQQQQQQHPGGPRQVVSSLFSKNPRPRTAFEAKNGAEEEEDAKPTNAPLIDGLDTFTNLGLSAPLAAHLLTKLEVKAPTAIQKASITQLLKEESDAFIQAETGSGKTMAYLLPLVQRIMTISLNQKKREEGEQVQRDSGLFAIVLAPTRELCKQIAVVLEGLLRCAHWIVAGTVIGGEKKKSEKARLRKGLNILVATPGRLADHLENTQALDVSNVRWLVLDEGDRLMELGFEKELAGIIQKLDARQRPSRIPGIPAKRTTILCSATLKMTVQKLGEISLKDAVHIQADPADEDGEPKKKDEDDAFRVPAQLKQSYAIVASKLRLVTLTAYMKRTFMRKGSVMKAIIFVSCADSVDFHFEVFTRKNGDEEEKKDESEDSDEEDEEEKRKKLGASAHGTIAPATAFSNPSNPVTLHRLHGSLPQHVRTATLGAFARNREPSVLICTDVASRGLDLPNVDLVVEYDPAFSAEDHLHRIGRTARLGRDGRAHIFLMPGCEEGYVDILKKGYRDGGKSLTRNTADDILKRGFGGNVESQNVDWEEKATEWQLDVERWALENKNYLEMARRAYQSHIRAYATHIANERSMFNIKELHLGHLAKSFALRDRPSKINVPGLRQGQADTKKDFKADRKPVAGKKRKAGGHDDDDDDVPRQTDTLTAAQKMRAKMKEHMAGASEFNLA